MSLATATFIVNFWVIFQGLHPLRVAEGFDIACEIAVQRVREIALEKSLQANNHEAL